MRRSTLVIFGLLLGCIPALSQHEEDRAKPCNAACRAWTRSDQALRSPAYVVLDDDEDDEDDDGYDDAEVRLSPAGRLRERHGVVETRKAARSTPPAKPMRATANQLKPS